MDELFAQGWRHSGFEFYRYNYAIYESELRAVIPLRIRLANFAPSKSQRRTLRRNEDLRIIIRPTDITNETEAMFRRHASRFKSNPPSTLFEYFFVADPATVPCECKEFDIYKDDRLIAASYIDIGERSVSGVYGMFEPRESDRRLGIFTMLKEIEFAIEAGKDFYYLGYCYDGPSFYDYKKQFAGTEAFQWDGTWHAVPRS
jgi:arginine-tRNA-protein transferase